MSSVFSETHLDDNVDTSSLILEGFDEPIRKDRTHYGWGIMVYLSNLLRYRRRVDLENARLESVWLTSSLNLKTFLTAVFYRSDFRVSQEKGSLLFF